MRRVVRNILLLLDGLLLVLFAAGYAAAYVDPEQLWWLQIFAPAVPYLSGMLLLTGVGLLVLSGGRVLFAVQLVLAVLVAVRFVSLAPVQGRQTVGDDTLRVVTFNARRDGEHDRHKESTTGLEEDIHALVRIERPHLIAFQEVQVKFFEDPRRTFQASHIDTLAQSLDYSIPRPNRLYVFGMLLQPVMSRIERIAVSQMPFTEPKERMMPSSSVTRIAFEWKGGDAVLYNVHLHSFDTRPWTWGMNTWLNPAVLLERLRAYREDYLMRAAQARRLRQMMEQETVPMIVCGDFNSTPHNWAYRHVSKGLIDAFMAEGSGWGSTYHADLPFARIDYILTTPHWEVASAHVSREASTDHLPLVARLVLRDR